MNKVLAMLLMSSLVFGSHFEEMWQEVVGSYQKFGGKKYMIQEEITQINHVLQAASIAKEAGAPDDIVVALLFHDIGQVIREEDIGKIKYLHKNHAQMGAEWLEEKGFPETVVDFVKFHALAKVMLCEWIEGYYESLSEASRISYHIQKAKYEEEPEMIKAFLSHPKKEAFLAARMCDDMAKMKTLDVNKNLPGFEEYEKTVKKVLNREAQSFSGSWIKQVQSWHEEMRVSRSYFENKIFTLLEK